MKHGILGVAAAFAASFAVGLWAAPALVSAGLTAIGAFSAVIVAMLVCYFAAEMAH